MSFNERFGWLLLGCLIGLFAGYMIRYLQEMKEELDEVDGILKSKLGEREDDKEPKAPKNERGYTLSNSFRDILLLVVVAATVFAAFSSQHASNVVKAEQTRSDKVNNCNQEFLTKTVKALNERAAFAVDATKANVELQNAQADFFALLLEKPPKSEAIRTDAAQNYLKSLQDFVAAANASAAKAELFPYPDNENLSACYKTANN